MPTLKTATSMSFRCWSATGLCPSRGEARRLVQQGGVTIDDVKVASIDESLARERFEGEGVIVRKGKKVFHRVKA